MQGSKHGGGGEEWGVEERERGREERERGEGRGDRKDGGKTGTLIPGSNAAPDMEEVLLNTRGHGRDRRHEGL